MKRHALILVLIFILVILGALGLIFRGHLSSLVFNPTNSIIPSSNLGNSTDIETIASNLDTPWGIAVLPNGDLLITERQGRVQRIGDEGTTLTVAEVEETSEGGLLGIVLHPEFTKNQYVYLYFTTNSDSRLINQVARYRFDNNRLSDKVVILDNIPASQNHDGGFLAFGPDKKLYVTTGDAGNESLAQDTGSLAGKILRVNDNGSIPTGNPFNNAVWSYGHRNPQGLAWDDRGRLWSTEHGPSGIESGRDELNLITSGANYGWPEITGSETRAGMVAPVAQSGDSDTWAPASLAYANGSLYFTGLRGQALYQAEIQSTEKVSLTKHFHRQYGRLRALISKDDALIMGTSNNDGRGTPKVNDDHLYRIPLSLFSQ